MSHSLVKHSQAVSLPCHLLPFSSFPRGKPIPQKDQPQKWNMMMASPTVYCLVSGSKFPLATTASGILLVLQTWQMFWRQLPGGERDEPSCTGVDPKLHKYERPLQRNWKGKMPRNVPARPMICQNAMILPIALWSFLEGPSFGFLQEHNGRALGFPFTGKLCSLCAHMVWKSVLWMPVWWCSPFLLPTDARELTPKPKSEQAMPLLICLYSGQQV